MKIDESFVLIHKIILSDIDDSNSEFYRSVRVRISGSQTVLPYTASAYALFEIVQKTTIFKLKKH